ncbi:MAG: hypothetical protein MUO43_14280 [Desulfobacterales bacterium]|nr:hypothetical protein [Desulfobacterales bacterium]
MKGDGALGYCEMSPYCRIAITAACPKIPPPLVEQLGMGGKLIAPVFLLFFPFFFLFVSD